MLVVLGFGLLVVRGWVCVRGRVGGGLVLGVLWVVGRHAKVAGEVRLLNHNAESDAAANSAYESARRAILRCQSQGGFPLPEDKYEQWRRVQMTFDPEQMVIQ